MANRMKDRIVAVTGASRGLGAALAEALVAEGAQVALLARPSDHRDKVAEKLGPSAIPIDLELSDPQSVRQAFGAIADRFGRIDALVNNAALAIPHLIEEASDSELLTEVSANFLGPVYCIREATALLRSSGGGDIVNISSVSVNSPFPMLALYAATKSAIETLGSALSDELKDDLIRVTTFRVGALKGESFGSNWPADRRERALGIAQRAGRQRQAGVPVELPVVASAIVDVLALAPEARIPIIEFRPR
jgi:meso-butanediol dehydrogenase/(S,S)-butanediol dehydrogenase/diacetyl reductase